MKIQIKNRLNNTVIVEGDYDSVKVCLEQNRGAYLSDANLRGANLRGANLSGAKNITESHDIFIELCRRQDTKNITDKEWVFLGMLAVHRICWSSIKKRFGREVLPLFKKIADAGWPDYLKRYEEVLNDE